MSETKTCTPEQLLAGFARMSPDDQEKVRARIMKGTVAGKEASCCDPTSMVDQMMARITADGRDPLAVCKEMMRKMSHTGP